MNCDFMQEKILKKVKIFDFVYNRFKRIAFFVHLNTTFHLNCSTFWNIKPFPIPLAEF